jgi:hypothetical protein
MPKELFHPEHVHLALARLEAVEDVAALVAAIGIRSGPDEPPPEALVRLLRRCRAEPDRRLETAVLNALVRRVERWVAFQYRSLSREDREEVAQDLLTTVIKAVARTAGIDWWEITFLKNLKRAAADIYESLFDKALRTATADIGDLELEDEGRLANDLLQQANVDGRLAKILTPAELALFYPLFMTTIPIAGDAEHHDLVRLLGIPEGTLREKKTLIRRKLEDAFKKEPL